RFCLARVASKRPFERLEPYDGKLSRTVLRGAGAGNGPRLTRWRTALHGGKMTMTVLPDDLDWFLACLGEVRWCSQVGQPVADPTVTQLSNWDDWPGPDDPRVSAVIMPGGEYVEELLASHRRERADLKQLYERVSKGVRAAAAKSVAYDD